LLSFQGLFVGVFRDATRLFSLAGKIGSCLSIGDVFAEWIAIAFGLFRFGATGMTLRSEAEKREMRRPRFSPFFWIDDGLQID